MTKRYDIIIVGAGLVGLSLALALKNSSLTIGIIEAKKCVDMSFNEVDARSIALSYSTKKIFDTLGIWRRLVSDTTPITKIAISDAGHFGKTRISAQQQHLSALGFSVQLPLLAKVLRAQLQLATNITWHQPATVENIHEHTLYLKDATQRLSAKVIIAADGHHSKTRELLGIAVQEKDYQQSVIATNVTLSREHQHIAYERFTKNGPLALLPIEKNRMALVWTTTPEQADSLFALDEQQFLQQLQRIFGYSAGEFIQVSRRVVYPLIATVAQQQIKPGVVILGNAAHTLHPVAAQGFNLALRDVARLAELLITADADNLGDVKLLQQYQAACQLDQQQTIAFTNLLINVFSNDIFPVTLARNLGLSFLDKIPPLKKLLTKRAMGFRGKATKLLRGLPLA